MITGAAACTPLIIPGITFVISTLRSCSATGTICTVTKFTNSPAALITFWNTPANASNTAAPRSPKISLILSRAAPIFPSEKTFFIVSPMFVTAATILSKTSSPFSPKIFPTAVRTLSRFFRKSCTAVITAVITPTTGRTFPIIPPSGPRIVVPSFPSGPSAVVIRFPIGAISVPILLNPDATKLAILPSGDFAIIPPIPASADDIFPPTKLKGLRIYLVSFIPKFVRVPDSFPPIPVMPLEIFLLIFPRNPPAFEIIVFPAKAFPTVETTPFVAVPTFEKYDNIPVPAVLSFAPSPTPAVLAARLFPLNKARAVWTVFIPPLISKKPSFAVNPAAFNSSSPPTTFVMVCTNSGLSASLLTIPCSFSSAEFAFTVPSSLTPSIPSSEPLTDAAILPKSARISL